MKSKRSGGAFQTLDSVHLWNILRFTLEVWPRGVFVSMEEMFVVSSSYAIPSTCPSLISRRPGPQNSTQTDAFLDRESHQTKSTLRPFPSIPSLWNDKWMMFRQSWSLKAVKVLMRAKPWGYFGLSTVYIPPCELCSCYPWAVSPSIVEQAWARSHVLMPLWCCVALLSLVSAGCSDAAVLKERGTWPRRGKLKKEACAWHWMVRVLAL